LLDSCWNLSLTEVTCLQIELIVEKSKENDFSDLKAYETNFIDENHRGSAFFKDKT